MMAVFIYSERHSAHPYDKPEAMPGFRVIAPFDTL
jgi:hypothetical protein